MLTVNGVTSARPAAAQAPSHNACMGDVTTLLHAARAGDAAALGGLYELLYAELRRLARAKLREGGAHTVLDTTGLVHESFMRLLSAQPQALADRGHFMAYAARAMRSVVVDFARRRGAQRRGGDLQRVTWTEQLPGADDTQVLQVNEALEELAAIEPRLAQVVEMRYFAGLADTDIAQALGLSTRTVERDWGKARLFLVERLRA